MTDGIHEGEDPKLLQYMNALIVAEESAWNESAGKFFFSFAAIESELGNAVRYLSGMDPKVADVILKDMNADKAIRYIRGLLKHVTWGELERASIIERIDQLDAIRAVRNGLAHRVATKIDYRVREVATRTRGEGRSEKITTNDLKNMTIDLNMIQLYFSLCIWDGEKTKDIQDSLKIIANTPWAYTRK